MVTIGKYIDGKLEHLHFWWVSNNIQEKAVTTMSIIFRLPILSTTAIGGGSSAAKNAVFIIFAWHWNFWITASSIAKCHKKTWHWHMINAPHDNHDQYWQWPLTLPGSCSSPWTSWRSRLPAAWSSSPSSNSPERCKIWMNVLIQFKGAIMQNRISHPSINVINQQHLSLVHHSAISQYYASSKYLWVSRMWPTAPSPDSQLGSLPICVLF